MGCLKRILNIIILSLAVVGFISIGGKEWVTNLFEEHLSNSKESLMKRAGKMGDFSALSDEFEIDQAASAFGYSGVLAEHNASGQKLIILDSSKKPLLTKEDFANNKVEEKLIGMVKKFNYKSISVDDIKVTKRGTMHAYGKQAPYARFTAHVKKLPVSEVSGIISCVDINETESRVLIAVNEKEKYSQLVTNEFFRKIKP